MTIERTNDEELLSGIVKRAWKHSNNVGEAPGDTSLAGFKDNINYSAFIDWLRDEGINVDDGFDIEYSCRVDSWFTLEDLWKALTLPEPSEPAMNVLDIPEEETVEDLTALNMMAVDANEKAGIIDEVKESVEDLTAIHEAAIEEDAE